MWIDYGIKSRGYDNSDLKHIVRIAQNPMQNVSLGIISEKQLHYDELMVGWKYVVVGTMFTMELNQSAHIFLEEWRKTYDQACLQGLYPYEESIFYHIYKNRPELFSVYHGNYHNCLFTYKPPF